jgi:hypothetical protein
MSRRGTDRTSQATLDGLSRLTSLARVATSGEVSEAAHVAGRARFLEAIDGEPSRGSQAPMRFAFAMAACFAFVAAGWGVQKWRTPEFTVSGAVASEGFVRAPAANSATVSFADGSDVVLTPQARVRVVRGEKHHVVLEEGKAEVRISHGPMLAWAFDAGPFTVHASPGGLAMAWSGDGEQLDVWPHDAETKVQGGMAGAGVSLHGGDHLMARVRDGQLRIERADGQVSVATNGVPTPPPAPTSPALAAAAGSTPDVSPVATIELPADAPLPSASATTSNASPAPHSAWAAMVARGEYDAVLREADAAGIDGVLARRPLADLAALADASRYKNQTDLAQRALSTERSRFPSSKEAHTAAFLLGRLADDQSHDPARAITWYTRYLTEASSGPFASDALGRKMIAVEKTKGTEAARPLAEQYAHRFPHGAYAAQAEEIRTR